MKRRRESFKGIVRLWVDLFDEHNLLTYASAIAFQAFIAVVALVLLGLGLLGITHDQTLWTNTIAPAIEGRVLPDVFSGINEVVFKVFSSSSAGLVAFASALAVWEVSGVVRASMGALNGIYEDEETRPWWIRFPLSFALSAGVIAALIGAVLLVWVVHVKGGWSGPLAVVRWIAAVALIVAAFGIILRWAPVRPRASFWASAGSALVVVAWIVETLIFRWYITAVADFRTAIGSLEVFIVGASYLYVGSIILLVAMELDELVRQDLQQPKSRRQLLPLVVGVLRG